MTKIRNSSHYEVGLLHPKCDVTSLASAVSSDYSDGLEAVDSDRCVEAPDGPGLGVEYDWDLIESRRLGGRTCTV